MAGDAAALTSRAQTLLDLGRPAEAEAAARQAVAAEPGSAAALRVLALALSEQHRTHEAWEVARAAVQLEPDNSRGLIILAEAYHEAGDRRQALAAADAAVRCAPHHWATYYTRGHVRLDGTKRAAQEALTDLLQARQLAPHLGSTHNVLGMCYDDLGRRREAQAAYEEALRLDPTDATAMNNLAALELNRGRVGRASQHLTSGLLHAPQTEMLHRNFDVVLLQLLRRLWWLVVVIALGESVLLGSQAPWAARAGVGVAAIGLLVWVVRRTLRTLPRGTPQVLRGLWARATFSVRTLLGLWATTLACALTIAFAPDRIAQVAFSIGVIVVRILIAALIWAGIIGLVKRVIRR